MTSVAISVDIQHPYIGDLQVSLTAPGGSTVVLHNRTGASADNIVKTYTSENTPALAGLVGQQAQGDWRLQVADLAARDVGILRHWRLGIGLEASSTVVRGEAAPALSIPDNNPTGISSAIAIAQSGTAQAVKVSVDITHTYVGDLRVTLVAPSGQQVVLHDRLGGSQDDLITTYDSATTSALVALFGQAIEGNWTLRVSDLAGRDVGKLNAWSVELAL
jgi:subtilisin-like proprotein convertase family protein